MNYVYSYELNQLFYYKFPSLLIISKKHDANDDNPAWHNEKAYF